MQEQTRTRRSQSASDGTADALTAAHAGDQGYSTAQRQRIAPESHSGIIDVVHGNIFGGSLHLVQLN